MSVTQEPERSMDDQKLMQSIARGRTGELGLLYEKHKEKSLALAYRILGQWNLAEDICQEAFLRVQQAAHKYRPEAEFSTWLYRIIVNLCLDEKRRQKRIKTDYRQIKEISDTHVDTSPGRKDKSERIDALWKAMNKLNERQRTAVILHKIKGLSHADISGITGWSQSSVESLLVRAYKKLRKELISSEEI